MPLVVTPTTDPDYVGGSEVNADNSHILTGLGRLIERWRADSHPNLAKLLEIYLDAIQEFEDALWGVYFARLPDFAEGVHLDALGRVVGERRNGSADDRYRARISVRIRINQSYGRPKDVIEMLQLLDPAGFRLTEFPTASFRVDFTDPPANGGVGQEIPGLVRETRAAGVSAIVSMPVNSATPARNAFFGSVYSPTLNSARGFSSSYDTSVGGLFGHSARA